MIQSSSSKSLLLISAGLVAPVLAARAARTVAGKGYEAFTHEPPPKNPTHPQVELRDAVIWAVTAGAVGGLARMAAGRLLAHSQIPAEGYDMAEALEE